MDTTADPPFDESLAQVVRALPSPIRKFFLSGKVEAVSKVLFETFRLHVDQGAILERELILLLLGLKSPVEFMETLREEGHIDAETVKRIANEANTRIFLPLREEMRKGVAGREQEGETSGGARAAALPRPSVSVPRYAPPQNHSQAAPLPVRQVPAPPQAARAAPAARLPITDPERELPAGEPVSPPARPFVPAPVPAPRSFAEPGQASSSPPRPSSAPLPPRAVLPGASQGAAPPAPAALRPQPPAPRAPAQSAPPANLPGILAPKQPLAPTASPSAADPYREPIE